MGSFAGQSNLTGSRNFFAGYKAGSSIVAAKDNHLVGYRAGELLTSGTNNVFIGNEAGNVTTTSNQNTLIGAKTEINNSLVNSIALGYGANVTMSNAVAIGSGSTRFGMGTSPSNASIIKVNGTTAVLTLGGAWPNASDRNIKENVTKPDQQAILEKVMMLPVSQWNYIKEDDTIKHIGPMAQDFYALFGLGGDDKTVSTIDPAGVALVAIQALYQKQLDLEASQHSLQVVTKTVSAQQSELTQLKETLAEIKAQIQTMQ
jgi:hypothetical protein